MRSELLVTLRTLRGLTQEELSEQSGISVRTIRNLERGRVQSPRRSSLDLLFSVLEPDVDSAESGFAAGFVTGVVGRHGMSRPLAAELLDTPASAGCWRGPRPPRAALVGRDGDLDRLGRLVASGAVTVLTGPGGVGKTRLALAVAERGAAGFPGGVAVAQLGRIPAVSGSGGDADGASALCAAREAVVELLGSARQPGGSGPTLLVLDTTEHLPRVTASLVEQLREAWPDLRLLITTRRPAMLPEARIWETAPLPEDAAVELMCRRLAAGSVGDGPVGSPQLMVQLCQELGYVPRLIESAAYWLRSVPMSALLSPGHVLELLGSPDFSLLPHQRSLLSCLDWSWGLLSARQRQFMIRLAELPEPFSSDMHELTSLEGGMSEAEAVCLLGELADASMLQVQRGERYAYSMFRHVRTFVRRRAAPAAPTDSAADSPIAQAHAGQAV